MSYNRHEHLYDLMQYVSEEYAYFPNMHTFVQVVSSRLMFDELCMLNGLHDKDQNKDQDQDQNKAEDGEIMMKSTNYTRRAQKQQLAECVYLHLMLLDYNNENERHYLKLKQIKRKRKQTQTQNSNSDSNSDS